MRSSVLYLVTMATLSHFRSRHICAGESLSSKQAKVVNRALKYSNPPACARTGNDFNMWIMGLSVLFYFSLQFLAALLRTGEAVLI